MTREVKIMRKVINISVPEPMERFVKCRVENGDFGSVSEYFRYLIRTDQMRERTLTTSLGIRPPRFDIVEARARVERNTGRK